MGYRERRAHKSQQKQEALGKAYSSERRVSIPAPQTMDSLNSPSKLSPSAATLIEDFTGIPGGLAANINPKIAVKVSAEDSNDIPLAIIPYDASGTASSECWLVTEGSTGPKFYNIREKLTSFATATASVSLAGTRNQSVQGGDYTIFNKTVIWVGDGRAYRWNRASAWEPWSMTCSGGNVDLLRGITNFKTRLIGWEDKSTKFWYGSTDQVLGTMNSFDLGGLISGNIQFISNWTKDGGAGPDDYLVAVSDKGETVVYAGTDPAVADNWSLVGTYQIGSPCGHKSFVNNGSQIVVMCEDDFYFIPQDLMGKKQSTIAVDDRSKLRRRYEQQANAVWWKKKGLLVFADGSVFDTKNNFAYYNMRLNNEPVDLLRETINLNSVAGTYTRINAVLGVHDNRLLSYATLTPLATTSVEYSLFEINPSNEISNIGIGIPTYSGRIRTAPINTPGRTVIHMVNPVFKTRSRYKIDQRSYFTASAPTALNIKYRTAVVYDKFQEKNYSASANAWLTTSTSVDSEGFWVPGFGNGQAAQVFIDLLTSTASAEIYLDRIDITLSDTGGI